MQAKEACIKKMYLKYAYILKTQDFERPVGSLE